LPDYLGSTRPTNCGMLLLLGLAAMAAAGLETEFSTSAGRLRSGLPANSAVAFWCMYIPSVCTDTLDDNDSGRLPARIRKFAIDRGYNLQHDTCSRYTGPGAENHVGMAVVSGGLWDDEQFLFSGNENAEIVTTTDVLHLAAEIGDAETTLCPCAAGNECVGPGVYAPKICVPMQPADLRNKQAVALIVIVAAAMAVLYVVTDPR